jgi:hypothetical protein
MLSGTDPSSPASFEGKKTIVDGLGVAATLTQGGDFKVGISDREVM